MNEESAPEASEDASVADDATARAAETVEDAADAAAIADGAEGIALADGAGEAPTDGADGVVLADGGGEDAADDASGEASDDAAPEEAAADGGQTRAYTVRLELVDEPGELLNALHPIADNGGNLLSIFHERGNVTPRGRIPVEVDVECHPDQFEGIVDALRDAGVNVTQAGRERYGEEVTLLLVGHVVDTDLSDTLERLEAGAGLSVTDIALSAPEGTDEVSSARMRIATEREGADDAVAAVREIAEEKDLNVIEPLLDGRGEA